MKKILLIALVTATAALAAPTRAHAATGAEVRLAPLSTSFAPPRLAQKQGWLTITNRDWKPYTITISRKGRMALTEGELPTGTVIRSGNSVTFAVEKDTWELLGPSGDDLKCRVREGRTSTISLEPFGLANTPGLRGISNDGERVREEILVPGYAPPPQPIIVQRPPVVVQTPPPVIVQRPPVVVQPPPPVIVQRPPIVVQQPPVIVHTPPRPHPPRPPVHRPRPGRDRDGWSFSFGFSR